MPEKKAMPSVPTAKAVAVESLRTEANDTPRALDLAAHSPKTEALRSRNHRGVASEALRLPRFDARHRRRRAAGANPGSRSRRAGDASPQWRRHAAMDQLGLSRPRRGRRTGRAGPPCRLPGRARWAGAA